MVGNVGARLRLSGEGLVVIESLFADDALLVGSI